ncbi:Sorbin and SH3 domain-containing protein 2, partial [Physocladia obscura]
MNNPTICSTPTATQTTKRAEYIDLFIALDNSVATSSSNCTVAVSMDSASYCGLSTAALGQTFCNNQYDPCCTLNGLTQVKSAPVSNESTTTTTSTSTSAFTQTQIEIGAGVVAALLAIVLVCVCFTRQRRKNRELKEDEADLTSPPSVRSGNTNNNYNNYNNNNYKGNNYDSNDYEMNSTQVQTRFDYAPSLSNSQGQYPAAYPQQQYTDQGSVYSVQQNNMQQIDRAGSRGSESYYKSIVPQGNFPPLPNSQLAPQFQRQQQEKKYWVILNFRALKHDEMELVVGDIITVKESYDDGWCLGSNPMTGASGFVPLDCLSEVPIGSGPAKAKSKFNNRVSSIYGHEGLIDDGSFYVKFDYYPAMSDELPLRTGDRAVVFDEYDDGWCFGANAATREEGLFPLDILTNFISKKFTQTAHRKDRGSSLHSSNLRKGAVAIGLKAQAANKTETDTFESIYDFNPAQPDELTLRIGDKILIKRKYDDGWAFGTNLSNGSDGLFPLDCLAMDAKTPRKQRTSSIFGSQNDSNGNIYSVYAESNNGTAKKDPNSDRVVFNYVPERPDEISLTIGDEVILSQKFDDGWGIGRNISTGREGNFPLDCLASFSDPNAATNNGSKQTKQRVSSIFEIDASKTLSSSSGTETVIYDYEPERPDELALRVGDRVIISQKFDDG